MKVDKIFNVILILNIWRINWSSKIEKLSFQDKITIWNFILLQFLFYLRKNTRIIDFWVKFLLHGLS